MRRDDPIILWFRRDFRLADHPALSRAAESGRPVIPVFVLDEVVESHGAAPKFRLGLAIDRFDATLRAMGSRLTLRRGRARDVLARLADETGAGDVWWTRAYDPEAVTRDKAARAALTDNGLGAGSFRGHLMFEPWEVQTGAGGYYKVFTPFWRATRGRDVATPLGAVASLRPPRSWPASDRLADWDMAAAMHRGADVVRKYVTVDEAAATGRLGGFLANDVDTYREMREYPARPATSRLSENLTYGEISPRACWHAGARALERGAGGAEAFLRQLVWREFAYHLTYHTPRLVDANWRPEWDNFPWNEREDADAVRRWKQGRIGVPFVDAAMRELYTTGYMHNRGRLVVASYLTKHLLTHWRIGERWFADTLVDWDPANNALGWQWAAGSGPDATPYFRIFNPDTQLDRFDRERAYVRTWIAEKTEAPGERALDYFAAIPKRWGLAPDDPYPAPVVGAAEGRKRALAAYENRDF